MLGTVATIGVKIATAISVLWTRILVFFQINHLKNRAKSVGSLKLNGVGSFSGVSNLSIGNNVHVGAGARWACEGGVTIGDNAHISRFVTIYSRSHNFRGSRIPYDDTYDLKSVQIERNVWIGSHVMILPGSKIGEGAVIGAGAIVAGDIPPLTIWGMKGQAIGKRDEGHYTARLQENAIGGINGKGI